MNKHMHGGDVYRHPGCTDFSANCNPLGTPDAVKEAVKNSIETLSDYPQVGYGPLKCALAEYEAVPSSWVICGNGAAELIFSWCRAQRPRNALLPAPTFAEYEQALESSGCRIRHFYLQESSGFCPDRTFLDALTEDLDVVFLCNPNNPTGVLLSREFLLEILSVCRKNGICVVLDECFLDFVKEPDRYTLKEFLKEYPELFLLKAFTKRYAMAGLRLGYGLCANRRLLDQMERGTQPWNISTPAQMAGCAALTQKEYVEAGRMLVFQEAAYLKQALMDLGYRVYASQANYIFFKAGKGLYQKCLEQGILIRDCSNYVGLSEGYYRVAVKRHEDNERLIQALQKIERG